MFREALAYLAEWKDGGSRKPLVIRGARQVGKTHLVLMFGDEHFENIVHVNFERQPELGELFASGSPERIVALLELKLNVQIRPGRTLLFLDEIQAACEVLATLRYFYEEMPRLHVIAAGSLLEFMLSDHTFSMPVGRIEYLYLGPMMFEEYLAAAGQVRLIEYLRGLSLTDDVPRPIHKTLMDHVRLFCATGGMPAVLAAWLRSKSFKECDATKQALLSTLEDDFGKYGKRIDRDHLLRVFRKIPLLVGRRFKYANVSREERSKTIRIALEALCAARIGYQVRHTSCNGVPLRAEVRENVFKALFLDVGLMTSACGLSLVDFENVNELVLVNQGAVSEQFIGQHLLYSLPIYQPPELFYWIREKPSSSAEVDYVFSEGSEIIPVEVRAGKTGRLRSLQMFMGQKEFRLAVRFNSDLPSITDVPIVMPGARRHSYRLLSLPLYLIGQAKRLARLQLEPLRSFMHVNLEAGGGGLSLKTATTMFGFSTYMDPSGTCRSERSAT